MADINNQSSAQSPDQLSEDQLQQVTDGVDFDQLRRENFDKDAVANPRQ